MDPSLELYRKELVVEAGRKLDKARMIRFEERTGYFASTDLGRTASHFYIRYNTIEVDSLLHQTRHHRGSTVGNAARNKTVMTCNVKVAFIMKFRHLEHYEKMQIKSRIQQKQLEVCGVPTTINCMFEPDKLLIT